MKVCKRIVVIKNNFMLATAMVFLIASNGFSTSEVKLNCLANRPGFMTSKVHAEAIDDKVVNVELAQFWYTEPFDPSNFLQIEGEVATNAKIQFPLDSDLNFCLFKQLGPTSRNLFACSTGGIPDLKAELTLVDGSTKTITLRSNLLLEAYQVQTTSVLEAENKIFVKIIGSKTYQSFQLEDCN